MTLTMIERLGGQGETVEQGTRRFVIAWYVAQWDDPSSPTRKAIDYAEHSTAYQTKSAALDALRGIKQQKLSDTGQYWLSEEIAEQAPDDDPGIGEWLILSSQLM